MNPPPIVPAGIVHLADDERVTLLGSRCGTCAHVDYPPVQACTECGAAMSAALLGSAATVHAVTAVRVKPPFGLPSPYWVGYVDLPSVPLRVFALFDAGGVPYRIGEQVELRLAALGVGLDGAPCRRPVFARPGAPSRG